MSRIIAIVPARGGSKRIPRKNLALLAGVPLVVHSIRHARDARRVHQVIVSTDDNEIAGVSADAGAMVVRRPEPLASDTATSEAALLHALDWWRGREGADPALVVFLQCTSPVRRPGDIDAAIDSLEQAPADSLLSVCESTRFIWAVRDGQPAPINYDYRRRQREQDLARQFQENGSIYLFRPRVLREEGNRIGGRIALYEMDYWSSFQIDTPEDLELCAWILERQAHRPPVAWPAALRLVVFDFDGVMTDNRVWVAQDGSEMVACSRADGLGLERLRQANVPMLVLSKELNPVVSARCAKLQIPCEQVIADKAAFLRALLDTRGIPPQSVAYVGNDVNDLECLRMVGLPVATGDAHRDVRSAARLVLSAPGGRGAVREFCDLVLAHLHEGVSSDVTRR